MTSTRPDKSSGSAANLLAGRYALGGPIGQGRSTVYRAEDVRLRRSVAVKQVRLFDGGPEDPTGIRRRAMREAHAAARLSDPAVVTVYDIIEEGDSIWLVMELVEAPSLSKLVADSGPLDPVRAARIGLDVLSALTAAHAVGVVHRDVKPANVMVLANDRAKLADFGVARLRDDTQVTAAGLVIGSPAYMAPEQARAERAGPAADLWALGATLYFGVEGLSPFPGNNAIAVATAVIYGLPRPTERAGPLAPLLASLLTKEPDERPPANEVRRALRDVVSGRARRAGQRSRRAASDPTATPPPVAAPPDAVAPGSAPGIAEWLAAANLDRTDEAPNALASAAAHASDPEVEARPEPEALPASDEPGAEPEPEPVTDGAPASERGPVAEDTPAAEPAPSAEADRVPEPTLTAAPTLAADPEPAPAVGAEPSADPEPKPELEPEPAADAQPAAVGPPAADDGGERDDGPATIVIEDDERPALGVAVPRGTPAKPGPPTVVIGDDEHRVPAASPAYASAPAVRRVPAKPAVKAAAKPPAEPPAEPMAQAPPARPAGAPGSPPPLIRTIDGSSPARRRAAVFALVAAVVLVVGALAALTNGGGDDDSGDRESATPTTSATTAPSDKQGQGTATTRAPATTTTAAPAVPAGWSDYSEPGGVYTIAHPPGWQVQQMSGGTRTKFRDPGTGTYLMVDWTAEPRPDPVADWQSQSGNFAARHEGYSTVRIEPARYRDYNAAVWEFAYRDGGANLHVANLGFVTGGRGYALYFQTHEENWAASQELFRQFQQAFRPGGAA